MNRSASCQGVDDAARAVPHPGGQLAAYESIFSPAYMAQHNTFERRFLYWMNVRCGGDGRTYLTEDDGQSIGYVTISYPRDEDLPSGTLELTSLYIRTAETGKGTAVMSCGGCSHRSRPPVTTA